METECPDIWPDIRGLPEGFELLGVDCFSWGFILLHGNWRRPDRYWKNIALWSPFDPPDYETKWSFVPLKMSFRDYVISEALTKERVDAWRKAGRPVQCCPQTKEEE